MIHATWLALSNDASVATTQPRNQATHAAQRNGKANSEVGKGPHSPLLRPSSSLKMQSTVAFKPAMVVRAAAPSRASRPAAARAAAPVAARTSFLSGSVAGSAASVRFVGKAAGKGGFRLVTAMAKKSVGDLTEADLKGKVVFERADLNVPLDKELNITDDTRIRVRPTCAGAGCCNSVRLVGWLQHRAAGWVACAARVLRELAHEPRRRSGVVWQLTVATSGAARGCRGSARPALPTLLLVAQVGCSSLRFAADAPAGRSAQAAIPTLQYLTSKGAKVMLTSHLVRRRPRGRRPSWGFRSRSYPARSAHAAGPHGSLPPQPPTPARASCGARALRGAYRRARRALRSGTIGGQAEPVLCARTARQACARPAPVVCARTARLACAMPASVPVRARSRLACASADQRA